MKTALLVFASFAAATAVHAQSPSPSPACLLYTSPSPRDS